MFGTMIVVGLLECLLVLGCLLKFGKYQNV